MSLSRLNRGSRLLLQSLRGEGLGFITLWARVRNAVPGWLTPGDARFLYAAAHHGPGTGAIVEIGSAWGRSTIFLARASKRASREKVHAIDPHSGQASSALARPMEDDWWPPRRGPLFGLFPPEPPWYLKRDYLAAHGSLPGFRHNVERFGVADWVIPVVKNSDEAARELPLASIRLLYIDGLHTYQGVRTDIEHWVPRVQPGGIVVFDDYFKPAVGVRRAVDELLASGSVEPRLRRAQNLVWTLRR
jgi:predicted O-methyltransferase YrrM